MDPNPARVTIDGTLAYAAGDDNAGREPEGERLGVHEQLRRRGCHGPVRDRHGRDTLVTQAPPNNGTLNTIGPLGVNPGVRNGFDISPTTGVPFAALRNAGPSALYRIDLGTGAATPLGAIGSGLILSGLTIVTAPPAA